MGMRPRESEWTKEGGEGMSLSSLLPSAAPGLSERKIPPSVVVGSPSTHVCATTGLGRGCTVAEVSFTVRGDMRTAAAAAVPMCWARQSRRDRESGMASIVSGLGRIVI